MPQIIDYPAVEQQMAAQDLICLYPNSGAFGFPKQTQVHAVGWVGGEDPTIRPEARPLTVDVSPPVEPALAALAEQAWRNLFPGPAWVMPKAHWAYELDFGSSTWMPQLLDQVGVNCGLLSSRHDGTAVAFHTDESSLLVVLLEGLLSHLLGSDFQLVFPGRNVVCTVHHHKQLWWMSPDEEQVATLRALAGGVKQRA